MGGPPLGQHVLNFLPAPVVLKHAPRSLSPSSRRPPNSITGQQEFEDYGQQQKTTAAGHDAPTRAVHDAIQMPDPRGDGVLQLVKGIDMGIFRTNNMLAGAVAVAALILGGCSGGVTTTSEPATLAQPPPNAQNLEQAYTSMVQRVLPSVVQVTTDHALGSGIVFDTQGNIVTNAHVVGQATKFQVRLADYLKAIPATLVGSYPPDDLAVIKLDQPPSSVHPAHFGDSATLQVGDIVMTMGNPLGLTGSVTDGIISATGRTVSGTAPAPGIGFAIPSNVVTDIAAQLIAHNGHVVNSHRAQLGVGVATVVDPTGQPVGMTVVSVVPGGPAAAAGIQPGEVITAVNNTPVHRASELIPGSRQVRPGTGRPGHLDHPAGRNPHRHGHPWPAARELTWRLLHGLVERGGGM
jgi:S1-C subfamily serine protease